MGTICIVLGLILLVLATGGGFMIAHMVASNNLYMTLLGTSSTGSVYIFVVGACFLIGLLICLGLVMNGLIYNRLGKNSETLKRLKRNK